MKLVTILLGEGTFFSEQSEDLGCLQVGTDPVKEIAQVTALASFEHLSIV